jgi:hypothetical protein
MHKSEDRGTAVRIVSWNISIASRVLQAIREAHAVGSSSMTVSIGDSFSLFRIKIALILLLRYRQELGCAGAQPVPFSLNL